MLIHPLRTCMASVSVDFQFQAPSNDAVFSTLNTLEILVTETTVVLALLNPAQHLQYFKRYRNKQSLPITTFLDSVCIQDEVVKHPFAGINIVYAAPHWLAVPSLLAPNGTEPTLIALAHSLKVELSPESIVRDVYKPFQLNLLYYVEPSLRNKFEYYFQKPQLRHTLTRLWEIDLRNRPMFQHKVLGHICLLDQEFIYSITEGNRLLFANRYSFQSPEDILFYVLSVNEIVKLPNGSSNDEFIIVLTGFSDGRSRIFTTLSDYLSNLADVSPIFPSQPALDKLNIQAAEYPLLLGLE
jgi:hypothetical protein